MANTRPNQHSEHIHLRADAELIEAVEELRALQRPVPSKSDAVRAAIFNELERLRAKRKAKS